MNPQAPGGGPPPSFKYNVNRQKTQRWVDAKSYSYDGDDWGELDDYDEYGGQEAEHNAYPPPQHPQHPHAGQMQSVPEPTPRVTGLRQPSGHAANSQAQSISPNTSAKVQHFGPPYVNAPPPNPATNEGMRRGSFGRGDEAQFVAPMAPTQPMTTAYAASNNSEGRASPANYGRMTPNTHSGRPSFESQGRPPVVGHYGPPRNDGSRAASMTSNSSSPIEPSNTRTFSNISAMPPALQMTRPPRKSSLSQVEGPPQSSTEAEAAPAETASANGGRDRSASGSTPIFVRPADIYRRMQEEKERERRSQESSRSSQDVPQPARDASPAKSSEDESRRHRPALEPVTERTNELQPDRLVPVAPSDWTSRTAEKPQASGKVSPKLPELAGVNLDFGDDFGSSLLGPSNTSSDQAHLTGPSGTSLPSSKPADAVPQRTQRGGPGSPSQLPEKLTTDPVAATTTLPAKHTQKPEAATSTVASMTNSSPRNAPPLRDADLPTPQQTSVSQDASELQHQPSTGLRSVVHTAFDRPARQTSSASGSVARTNSEDTDMISPIISRNPSELTNRGGHVSTIPEESLQTGSRTPVQDPEIVPRPLGENVRRDSAGDIPTTFTPGHRRDVSTPSPNNSPAITPQVEQSPKLHMPQGATLAGMDASATPKASQLSQGDSIVPTASHRPPQVIQGPQHEPPRSIRGSAPGSRTSSPNKNRVRDLADRFEDSSSRGSTSPVKSSPQHPQIQEPVRPDADRSLSFRPQLPGAWSSFASSAHPGERGASVSQTGEPFIDDSARSTSTPSANDPFKAAAAAGAALAESLLRSGSGSEPSEASRAQSESNRHLQGHESTPEPLHVPESEPTPDERQDALSIVATPIHMRTGEPAEHEYFSSIEPLKSGGSRPSSGLPVVEVSRPARSLSIENSPNDQESDRLRKELIRELSPQTETFGSDAHSSPPLGDHEEASRSDNTHHVAPTAGESYGLRQSAGESMEPQRAALKQPHRDQARALGPQAPLKDLLNHHHDEGGRQSGENETKPRAQTSIAVIDVGTRSNEPAADRPSLGHRFSWEQEADEKPDTTTSEAIPDSVPAPSEASPPEVSSDPIFVSTSSQPLHAEEDGDFVTAPAAAQPSHIDLGQNRLPSGSRFDTALSQVDEEEDLSPPPEPPEKPSQASPASQALRDQVREASSPSASDPASFADEASPRHETQPPSEPVRIPPFREILALKNSVDRTTKFNAVRQQFVEMETGLGQWLMTTAGSHPDHAEFLASGGKTGGIMAAVSHASSPLAASSNNAQGSLPSKSAFPSASGRAPAATGTVKSKDIFSSAGIAGAKGKAKDLFAKGRSKWRTSGGGDKVE